MFRSQYTRKLDIRSGFKIFFIALFITSATLITVITIIRSEAHDFAVFYYSAKAALNGQTIYNVYGPHELPYWYFPWLAWFYVPLAYLSYDMAHTVYTAISILLATWSINYLLQKFVLDINRIEKIFAFSMMLVLCWLLFRAGQMDFILLAAAVLTIHLIDQGKSRLAALTIPVLLFKPHLFILFGPSAIIKGKRKFLIIGVFVLSALIIGSFLILPDWPQQMLQMLSSNGQRTDNTNWNFTTLPNMLGMQENLSGTANLPITFALILTSGVVLWKLREIDTFPFLSLALAGSLFCAPRAYAYNVPILIPAMIWLSSGLSKPFRFLFWLTAAIVPIFFGFSSGTYSIIMAVFILAAVKAYKSLPKQNRVYEPKSS
jgi:hypothetical protein